MTPMEKGHRELEPNPAQGTHVWGPDTGHCSVDRLGFYSPYTQPMQMHSKMATKRRHIPLAA